MNGQQRLHAVGLLDEVRVRSASLVQAKDRYADQLAPGFHLLDHLRNDEMALSRYLGMLLDTKGAHAQGDLFLRCFVERLAASAGWIDAKKLQSVTLEKQANGQRRLDICLVFQNGVIGIENKPWAGDQPDQLKDYADYLKKAAGGGNWLLIYLCNDDPSENSIPAAQLLTLEESGNYYRLDFHQMASWLEHCACFTRAPKVRLFAEELAGYMRREINGEMEMTEAEEIKNLILERKEYIESAFQVSSSIHRLKEQLLDDFKKSLSGELSSLQMALVWDDDALKSGRKWAGFGAQFNSAHQLHLRFEFSSTGLNALEWGICRNHRDIKLDPKKSALINGAMEKAFGKGYLGDNWPWYPGQGPEDKILMASERNWSSSAEPWLHIRDQTESGFVARFVRLASDVKEALAEVDEAMR